MADWCLAAGADIAGLVAAGVVQLEAAAAAVVMASALLGTAAAHGLHGQGSTVGFPLLHTVVVVRQTPVLCWMH